MSKSDMESQAGCLKKKVVSVLLSADVKKFSVCCMQEVQAYLAQNS